MSEANKKTVLASGATPLFSRKYRTILVDPPWPVRTMGKYQNVTKSKLPYATMSIEALTRMPVGDMAADGCHLWLWTTNQFLHDGFHLLEAWGFTYLAPITWPKPNGMGPWFQHRTQTLLFGYKNRCEFNRERYRPTILPESTPRRHSEKPKSSYELIEAISDPPRLELFARPACPMFPVVEGWDVAGNEVADKVTFA